MKFQLNYVVLHQDSENEFYSTYFRAHKQAFEYCEELDCSSRAVYKVVGRDPMVLGAVNVFCSFDEQYKLEAEFKGPSHKIQFVVI